MGKSIKVRDSQLKRFGTLAKGAAIFQVAPEAKRQTNNFYCYYYDPFRCRQWQFSCRTKDEDTAMEVAVNRLVQIFSAYLNQSSGTVKPSRNIEHIDRQQHGSTEQYCEEALCGGDRLLSEFRDEYLQLVARDRSEDTVTTIRDGFIQLQKYLGGCPKSPSRDWRPTEDEREEFLRRGDIPVATITVKDCERFIIWWCPSAWTGAKHYGHLHAAFDYAVRSKYANTNPFDNVKKPKPVKISRPVLTPDEISDVTSFLYGHNSVGKRNAFFVAITGETGVREKELRYLSVEDIDLVERVINVRSTEEKTVKEKKDRSVSLSDYAITIIKEQVRYKAQSLNHSEREAQYLFPNQQGRPLSRSVVPRAFKRALAYTVPNKLKTRFHDLRGAFITRLGDENVPTKKIQEQSGHRCISTVERYLRTNKASDVVIDALNRSSAKQLQLLTYQAGIGEQGFQPDQLSYSDQTLSVTDTVYHNPQTTTSKMQM